MMAYHLCLSTDFDIQLEPYGVSTNKQLNIEKRLIDSVIDPSFFYQRQNRQLAFYTDIKMQLPVKGQKWFFDIRNIASFCWKSGESNINYQMHKEGTVAHLRYWLLHTVLPLYLSVEQIYTFIHAGCVEVNDFPVIFTGDSHQGKSTLTNFFLKQGHALYSDDKVGTYVEGDAFFAVPSHPYCRPFRKTEDLGFKVDKFAQTPKRIQAVYILAPSPADSKVRIIEECGSKKFEILRYNTDLLLPFLNQLRFEYIGWMARKIPVFTLHIPWNLDRLLEVYQALISHTKEIQHQITLNGFRS